MQYQHPFSYNIAETQYTYHPTSKTIHGTVKWLCDIGNGIPQKLIYLVADDSCQFNKVVAPKGIGVTAFLKVNFMRDITVSNVKVKVTIEKMEVGSSGKLKTSIRGSIYDDTYLYADYSGLFVESVLMSNLTFQLGDPLKPEAPYTIDILNYWKAIKLMINS